MFLENLIAAFLGLALHFAMKWASARQEQTPAPGFVGYVQQVPAQTAVAVFGAASVFWVAFTMDWLNPGMAFTAGYMGNSLADNVAKQFAQKLPK